MPSTYIDPLVFSTLLISGPRPTGAIKCSMTCVHTIASKCPSGVKDQAFIEIDFLVCNEGRRCALVDQVDAAHFHVRLKLD